MRDSVEALPPISSIAAAWLAFLQLLACHFCSSGDLPPVAPADCPHEPALRIPAKKCMVGSVDELQIQLAPPYPNEHHGQNAYYKANVASSIIIALSSMSSLTHSTSLRGKHSTPKSSHTKTLNKNKDTTTMISLGPLAQHAFVKCLGKLTTKNHTCQQNQILHLFFHTHGRPCHGPSLTHLLCL